MAGSRIALCRLWVAIILVAHAQQDTAYPVKTLLENWTTC